MVAPPKKKKEGGVWAAAIVLLLVAGAAVWLFVIRKKKKGGSVPSSSWKEGYSNIGDIDNVGAITDNYDLVDAVEMNAPGEHFADLMDGGHPGSVRLQTPLESKYTSRPLQRLDRIQGKDLLPRTSNSVTPYNIDVADPVTHSYMVNPPRVQLKNPRWENSLFMSIVGDVPIRYNPNICLVGTSRFGRDSWQGQGVFSPYYKALYNKYTGKAYKNMPLHIANEETVMS